MKINIDSYFWIGSTHSICQDYALIDPINNAIIVSDGCSSSKDTDFGSRILSKAAQNNIDKFDNSSNATFGDIVIREADVIRRAANLPDNSLDATLIIAKLINKEIKIKAYGDGTIVTIYNDGSLEITQIEYSPNAPFYLSYRLDKKRQAVYDELNVKCQSESTNQDAAFIRADLGYANTFDYNAKFQIADIKAVIILSDGVSSFTNVEDTGTSRSQKSIPVHTVLNKLLAFKALNGVFVQRRAKRFMLDMIKDGWQNNDDMSIAAIYLEDK